MWQKSGIQGALLRLLESRELTTPIERLLLVLVANRALAPSSKLHVEHWITNRVIVDSLEKVDMDRLYRAMGFLLEATEQILGAAFAAAADLLNLGVNLLFLGTTSAHFGLEEEDDDTERCEGLRKSGCGKGNRSDLPQVTIGFAGLVCIAVR